MYTNVNEYPMCCRAANPPPRFRGACFLHLEFKLYIYIYIGVNIRAYLHADFL